MRINERLNIRLAHYFLAHLTGLPQRDRAATIARQKKRNVVLPRQS
jgi:hypothetical protein